MSTIDILIVLTDMEGSCKFCKSLLPPKKRVFCNIQCKSEWQKTQKPKPVTKDWLYQKYWVEMLDCTQIAKIVNRDSKRVWEWLKDYGIPTRSRGWGKPDLQIKPGQVICPGRKHKPETRRLLSQQKLANPPLKGVFGANHPRYGKRSAAWKGGITPERQAVYGSQEWKQCVKAVWKRDNATCQNCKLHRSQNKDIGFDIHHIISFAVKELRCDVSNLVLLCEPCHYWVHSNKNTESLFIKEIDHVN